MNALERIQFKKQTIQLEICELKRRLTDLFEDYKHLEHQEVELYTDTFGTTECPTHNFNAKRKDKKAKNNCTTSITTKFKTLSKEEQSKLLQLLTLGDENNEDS